jgi:hypothetical protein
MKPVEIILCRVEGRRKNDGGDEAKVHCKHIWMCHKIKMSQKQT